MQSLIFFNKEGDNLNFTYDQEKERWEGDLLFHENSDETYKTIGLYTFERIREFEYENPGVMKLRKFQLFNEYRFQFLGSSYFTQSITKIELPNTDPNFYSKWIHGENFESKFPKGSQIKFDNQLFEFTNPIQTYTVVETKKNAILILSNDNNLSFSEDYGLVLGLTSTYVNQSISGINSIGIYNYVTEDLKENLSEWSEPDFYDRLYNRRKLNLVNTQKNDGIVTVKNTNLFDRAYYKYEFSKNSFTQSSDFSLLLTLKTEAPNVYTGGLKADGNKLFFTLNIPRVLKPGSVFTIPTSVENQNFITVDTIPNFLGNSNLIFYPTQSQVIWNNLIYECVRAHTWSATSSIDPDDENYWGRPKYLPVTTPLNSENLFYAEVHLSSNVILYTQSYTQSAAVTLGSFIEKFKEEFKIFDLDLYYKNGSLNLDLVYPTEYCTVDFYLSSTGTQSYASRRMIYERNLEILEPLKTEMNVDTNQNFRYNIVITDLDDYGLKIFINNQLYQQEIQWVYESSQVNYERTIDKTIRKWYEQWYLRLFVVGYRVRIGFTGGQNTVYFNTIILTTVYPNVPLNFEVEVGDTADFYIEHSEVVFKDISNYLSLIINNKSYPIKVVKLSTQNYDIPITLTDWVNEYVDELEDFGILVSSVSNTLIFKTRSQSQRLEYTVQVGKSGLPEEELYVINNKFQGRFGALITSNEIILPEGGSQSTLVDNDASGLGIGLGNIDYVGATWSFEDESFATGQILGINNTVYPWNNQEYNLITLEPQSMILDYRGPFWSTTDPKCDVSPYIVIGFSNGFGATGCIVVTQSVDLGGEFTRDEYQNSFLLNFGTTNSYTGEQYSITGNSRLQDILYTPITENLYIFGQKVSVMDGNSAVITDTIDLPGLTGPIQIGINPVNQFIYCLSEYGLHIIDTRVNKLENSFTFSSVYSPKKFEFNTNNGDFYLIYDSYSISHIWKSNNFSSTPDFTLLFNSDIIDLTFNPSENDMYFGISDNTIQRVEGSNRSVLISYQFDGLIGPLFYEPSETSVYMFDNVGLRKINNGLSFSFGSVSAQTENYFVYNNLLDQIIISQTNQFVSLRTDGGIITNVSTTNVGPMVVNQFDGDVYLASGDELKVLDTIDGKYKWSEKFSGIIKKIVYNPSRNSVFGIVPDPSGVFEQSSVVELKVTLGTFLQPGPTGSVTVEDNLYGTLNPNYVRRPDTWLKIREYIRKPKQNFIGDKPVDLVWKWVDDQTPEIFLFDFSGDQLVTTGSYSYLGEKPLKKIYLNSSPNKDINKRLLPEAQQTIFDEIVKRLDFIDSENDIRNVPEPMEVFIGYNSKDEGTNKSTLKLYQRQDISFTITNTPTNYDILQFTTRPDGLLSINLNLNSDLNFATDDSGITRGLKPGQILQVFITDVTNTRNKYISSNNGITMKIRNVFNKTIIGYQIDRTFVDEFTVIEDYPKVGKTTYLSVKFQLLDKEIGSFEVYGQTEIEDVRFKVELGNSGQLIAPEDTYIFKSYDINEQGIDWTFLNKKRKELLMVRDVIYSYIGSYKAIINAINYFGYNDLELYEYYRNINSESKDFGKLFKVEIPDIFDNTVAGWTPNDFIKHTLPNPSFEDTNLFNLTFRITDKEGTNLLFYSLEEVLIKLQGLKIWLQRNIIPLTHRILDITGRADFVGNTTITHRNYDTRIIKIKQDFSPFDFHLNEAYLMPINSGSTVYNCVIDFSVSDPKLSAECFKLKIRTYQTYKEWQPFRYYNRGDKVQYFQQIYESALDNNRLKNPRKYENVSEWSSVTNYNLGDYASYYREIYQYIGTQSSNSIYGTFSPSPVTDITTNMSSAKWLIMTEWKKVDYVPVQTLTEFRTGTHSYSFTVDSNLDPFILVEVTSDNGYGQVYNNKKTYEIRGTKDLIDDPGKGDPMGPFTPIVLLDSTSLDFKPTVVPELTILPNLYGLESYELIINSDKNISYWQLFDVVRIDCLVYFTTQKINQKSVKVIINVDKNTKAGTYKFKVRGYVPGGYIGETVLITGFTTVSSYGSGSYGLGIGLGNLF